MNYDLILYSNVLNNEEKSIKYQTFKVFQKDLLIKSILRLYNMLTNVGVISILIESDSFGITKFALDHYLGKSNCIKTFEIKDKNNKSFYIIIYAKVPGLKIFKKIRTNYKDLYIYDHYGFNVEALSNIVGVFTDCKSNVLDFGFTDGSLAKVIFEENYKDDGDRTFVVIGGEKNRTLINEQSLIYEKKFENIMLDN